jgi:DNA-binding CsgD family transcriptional regulator
MRSSQALIAIDTTPESNHPGVEEVIRSLVGLIEKTGPESSAGSEAANTNPEQVLLDAHVDGYRYLLLRMPKPRSSQVQLSPREQEIVRMVAKGHPNKVIADVLSISSWTVCTHLRRIFAKLGVGSRAAMVAQLLETRTLTADRCGSPDTHQLRHRRA